MPDGRFELRMGKRECSFCGGNVRVCGHGRERRAVFHTRHLGAVKKAVKVEAAVATRKMVKSESSSSQGKMPIGPSSLSKVVSSDAESPRKATRVALALARGVKRSSDGLGEGEGEGVGKRVKIRSDIFCGGI
ncbi:hypothetical protein CSAL01_12261 [Colletotrichum salicis]|uniref:Uncharacterized protein n=1 Tax=Colletotrichum salicis TaxID=1209931 RepID=A0A135V0L6_9PEZI|nr:hypothetical protein CSAL01_12261 [Colletotrichum salicis]